MSASSFPEITAKAKEIRAMAIEAVEQGHMSLYECGDILAGVDKIIATSAPYGLS